MLSILTDTYGMKCGPNNDELSDVFLLERATKEIQIHIEGLKNGKRAYKLLCELYSVRMLEERYIREEISTSCNPLSCVFLLMARSYLYISFS